MVCVSTMSDPAQSAQTFLTRPDDLNQPLEPSTTPITKGVEPSKLLAKGPEPSTVPAPHNGNNSENLAWDANSASNNNEDSLSFSLDLLPQSLYGGGVSAMSSRRPSYAAEFSSRPRLLDLPNFSTELPSSNFTQQQQQQQQLFPAHFNMGASKDFSSLTSAASTAATTNNMPLFESDPWLRPGDPTRNIWCSNTTNSISNARPGPELAPSNPSTASTTNFSPRTNPSNVPPSPVTGSLLLSPLIGKTNGKSPPQASQGSTGDFALETAIGSQRTFRSVSFSHAYDRRQLGSRSPPKSQALSSFYEDSVDEATDVLGNTHIDDSKRRILRPQKSHQLLMNPTGSHSLWFNETAPTAASTSNSAAAAAAAAALNRRHSFATTVDSHSHAQHQQQQLQHLQQQSAPRHPAPSNVIGSPVTPTVNTAPKPSPPNSGRSYAFEDPHLKGVDDSMYAEVSEYFNSDEFGRNQVILSAQPANGISPASAASLISVPSSKIYFVQFKASRVDVFFIPETSGLVVNVDDLVIVDADRGRDLGKVIRANVRPEEAGLLKWKQHQEQQAALQQTPGEAGSGNGAPSGPSVMTPKQILRYAQPTEIQQILNKQSDEEKAIKTCSAKVQEKNLVMAVLDAEYQWDRRKLTFFYSASYRIDFRDLVRDLFRIYKTRIWMCAVHTGQASQQQQQQQQQQLQQQYRPTGLGQEQDRSPMRYPQEQQQQEFSQNSFGPWQYSNPAMGNQMMVSQSSLQQAPPPPQYWNPMMYDHYGPSAQGPSSGSMVPGGGNYY